MESSDEESPNSSSMMDKETQKVHDNIFKEGYKDGIDDGRKEGFQDNFDAGYALAFKLSMQLGLLRGMIDALIVKDGALSTFLSPVVEKLKAEALGLTTLDALTEDNAAGEPKSQDEICSYLREKYTRIIREMHEEFIQIYPYGEDKAEKLLASLKQFEEIEEVD